MQVLCQENLLKRGDVDDGHLSQDGADHRVPEDPIFEEANLKDRFMLQREESV